jgi:predicted small secreted protein
MQTRRVLSTAACAALIGSALALSACNTVHAMHGIAGREGQRRGS